MNVMNSLSRINHLNSLMTWQGANVAGHTAQVGIYRQFTPGTNPADG